MWPRSIAFSRLAPGRALAGLVVIFLLTLAAVACSGDDTERSRPVHAITGLANVSTATRAGDAVWVTTSSRADAFSSGAADAAIVRVPVDGGPPEPVMNGLPREPPLVEHDGHVWAALEHRIVAFDADGAEATSVEVAVSGTLTVGDGLLWATGFDAGAIAIALDDAEVVAEVDTVRFPVSPVVAHGHLWLASATDGDVSVIDSATVGEHRNQRINVAPRRLTDVTPVSTTAGPEVWITDLDGDLWAISAADATFGDVRPLEFERPINRVIPAGELVVLLPTWGQVVLVADASSGTVVAELSIETIPVRGVAGDGRVWVTGDGFQETLTEIDLRQLTVGAQWPIGTNRSETTGPTQPIIVDDEIWVPNRGDDTLFVVAPGG